MNNAQTTAPGGTPAVPLAGSPDNPKKRAVYVALIGAVAVFAVMAAQSYRSVDRELTDAALARRHAVASLAAATLSEKMDRLVDLGVSLASRVLLPELIPAGKEERGVVESYRLGVNSYIVKPVQFESFLETVSKIGLYWVLMNRVPD